MWSPSPTDRWLNRPTPQDRRQSVLQASTVHRKERLDRFYGGVYRRFVVCSAHHEARREDATPQQFLEEQRAEALTAFPILVTRREDEIAIATQHLDVRLEPVRSNRLGETRSQQPTVLVQSFCDALVFVDVDDCQHCRECPRLRPI